MKGGAIPKHIPDKPCNPPEYAPETLAGSVSDSRAPACPYGTNCMPRQGENSRKYFWGNQFSGKTRKTSYIRGVATYASASASRRGVAFDLGIVARVVRSVAGRSVGWATRWRVWRRHTDGSRAHGLGGI